MATKIQLTYCGMAGEGATVKLAKQDAARKIEAVLDGYYSPHMLRQGDLMGLVWREPSGYCYKIIWADTKSGSIFGNTSGRDSDQKETLRACARHMAQASGSIAGLEQYLTDADKREHTEYLAWHERYKAAKTAGYTDVQAHEIATQRTLCVNVLSSAPSHSGLEPGNR